MSSATRRKLIDYLQVIADEEGVRHILYHLTRITKKEVPSLPYVRM